jgi:phage replication-related protein YjqB (UPF0714/DUF867 family)
MEDTYQNFEILSGIEKRGRDFEIRVRKTKSRIAVIAPHGGEIEPGTSEIATCISGADFTFYTFEGIKNNHNNKVLHITSTKFDEPECANICKNTDIVLAVHGTKDKDERIYVGGLHKGLKKRMIKNLQQVGFHTREDITNHSGRDPHNICNRGRLREGLQIEISNGLRKKMFEGLSPQERKSTTTVFNTLVESIRDVLLDYTAKNNLQSQSDNL